MKRALLLAALAACDHGRAPVAADAPIEDAPACATTLAGTVTAPNGTLPLYGVTVYVPRADPGPLADGVACQECGVFPGGSRGSALTDVAGHFTLALPTTTDATTPVVIQVGKWRRQLRVPTPAACSATTLAAADTRLPTSRTDLSPLSTGVDLPRVAITSGISDALECLVLALGIDPSEITNDTGGGRVQLYANRDTGSGPANARGADHFVAGWPGGDAATFGDAEALWASFASLARYDVVMMGCEGGAFPDTKPQAARDAMKQFADAGGRVLATHLQSLWLTGEAAWSDVATFDADANGVSNAIPASVDEAAHADAPAYAQWLVATGASIARDEVYVDGANYTCTAVDAPDARTWLAVEPSMATQFQHSVELFDFPTPRGGPACGRVVYSDLHVSYGSGSTSTVPYPMQCSTEQMFPQAKAFAFLFFGLGDCAALPD